MMNSSIIVQNKYLHIQRALRLRVALVLESYFLTLPSFIIFILYLYFLGTWLWLELEAVMQQLHVPCVFLYVLRNLDYWHH